MAKKKSDDERALLAAICADPEDDTVRLAYADWLDERGDQPSADRAAFIRTQIGAEQDLNALTGWARLDEEYRRFWSDSNRRKYGYSPPTVRVGRKKPQPVPPSAFDRGQELLDTRESEWLHPHVQWLRRYRESPSYELMEYNFRRGFLHRFTLDADAFRKLGSKLFESAPIRELWFPGGGWHPSGSAYAKLAGVKALTRLRSLDLRDNFIAQGEAFEAYEQLLLSPYLAELQNLVVESPVDSGPEPGGGKVFWGAHHLSNLESLVFESSVPEEYLGAFATRARLPKLTRLQVYFCEIAPETANALATSPGLAALRWLDLLNCRCSPRAKRALEDRFGDGLRSRKI